MRTIERRALELSKSNDASDVPTIIESAQLTPKGTLFLTVPKGERIKRVIISESGTHFGTVYYPD